MAWLKLKLPIEEEFFMEQQARLIHNHKNPEELREVAAGLFKNFYAQQDLTAQLIRQCAELEYENAKLSKRKLPSTSYMEWARSLYPHEPPAEHENDLASYAFE